MQEAAGGPPGLTLGANSRLISTGQRLGKQLGLELKESAHLGSEYVVAGTNKTIDAMGGAQHTSTLAMAVSFLSRLCIT